MSMRPSIEWYRRRADDIARAFMACEIKRSVAVSILSDLVLDVKEAARVNEVTRKEAQALRNQVRYALPQNIREPCATVKSGAVKREVQLRHGIDTEIAYEGKAGGLLATAGEFWKGAIDKELTELDVSLGLPIGAARWLGIGAIVLVGYSMIRGRA